MSRGRAYCEDSQKSRGDTYIQSLIATVATLQINLIPFRLACPSDDDVVVHGDAERTRHGDDRLGHLDVGTRGGRVAGGMVVDHHSVCPTTLMLRAFSPRKQRQGTRIGGGNECLFGMIPVPQSSSRHAPFEHA